MKKRFLSLLLSLVLVMGILPVMSLTASAAATPVFSDDFESYNADDVFYGSDGDSMMKDDNVMWALGASIKSTVETVTGHDGNPTKAVKIENAVANASSNSSYRFYVRDSSSFGTETGIYVMELKVMTGSHQYLAFGPLKRQMADYCLYGASYPFASTGSGWTTLRFVIDAASDKVMIYANGNLVTKYGENDVLSYTYTLDAFPTFLSFQNAKALGLYVYIDDVNFYRLSTVAEATAKSPADGASEVSKAVNPAVTFDTEILDAVIGSDATLSAANVDIVNNSDGSHVAVSSVALSADGKTVTATPASDLDYGTEYNVTFKNLKDIYGRTIADVSYTFTTMEQPMLSFSDVVFKKEALETDGTVITQLENGYISCEYSITNNHPTKTQNVLMFAVLWENDSIKSFLFLKKPNLACGETATYYGGFDVTDAANSKIETYIWDGITTMLPLKEKGVFTTNGYVTQ